MTGLFSSGDVPRGADEIAALTAEIAALGPITVQQLTSWFSNKKARSAREAREAGAGAGAGSRAAAEEDKSRAAAMEGRRPPETNVLQQHMGPQVAAAAAGTLRPAAAAAGAYPSAPTTASERFNRDYLDDKGFRRDEWGKLYKEVFTLAGDEERQFYPDDCAGNWV